MDSRELFLKAAERFRKANTVEIKQELDRLQILEEDLKKRTTTVLDQVFERYPLSEPTEGEGGWTCRRAFDNETVSDINLFRVIKGGLVERTIAHSCNMYRKVATRWVMIDLPAGAEFDGFVPEGCYAAKNLFITVTDLVFSQDGGRTWGEPDTVANLEVVTRLYTAPKKEEVRRKLEKGKLTDPFYPELVFSEKLRDDSVAPTSQGIIAEFFPYNYNSTQLTYNTSESLAQGLAMAIDDLERTLDLTVFE